MFCKVQISKHSIESLLEPVAKRIFSDVVEVHKEEKKRGEWKIRVVESLVKD